MMEMEFCYCCRVHHPKDQMRLYSTRQGMRWRCLRSIEAATQAQPVRDDFGRQQTAINRETASRQAEFARHVRAGTGAPPTAA